MAKGNKKVKAKIIDAAWKLFYKQGYDNTTVDDIIRLSNTSKGTYYYYFDSKDALLETLSEVLDEKYEELKQAMDPSMNSFDKLLYLCYEVHSMMEKTIDYELLASLYSSQLVTKGKRHLLDEDRTYYRLIHEIVREGQEREQISPDRTPEEITRLYGICERALVSDWCMARAEYSLAEYSRTSMPILLEHFQM